MKACLWIIGMLVVVCVTTRPAAAQERECDLFIVECHGTEESYHSMWAGTGSRGGDDHEVCMWCMQGEELPELLRLAMKVPERIRVNRKRSSVQILDCSGTTLIANIPWAFVQAARLDGQMRMAQQSFALRD